MSDALATLPRADLVQALRAARPDDPTVCEGWQARHLAAHVVLRERRPWLAASDRATADAAQGAADLEGFAALVDQIEQGPPAWSPIGWVDTANVMEMLVHAADVRRGRWVVDGVPSDVEHQTSGEATQPLDPEVERALWRSVAGMARMRMLRLRGGPGLVLVSPSRRAVVARGERSAVLRGEVLELALWITGRERASRAVLEGDPEAVAALQR